jgi:UDP-N-acetylmuramoyl-tripeptide--D-alanyl-D-alanine ligase
MTALWTVAEVVQATGGRPEGFASDLTAVPLNAVSIDSREVPADALFVAIKGERLDGHAFVGPALASGAAAAIVSEEHFRAQGGERLIVVADTLRALELLGQAARTRSRAFVVAVTGSAGKTTTKEAIRTVLQAAGNTHFSIKSFNNHWGVPLMLARLPREADFAVFEIGMNHAGEITPLVQLVRPHAAVITTVAAAHLEFFASVAEIAAAKAEIFSGLEPGGTAVLNADHDWLHILFAHARAADVSRVVTYGFDESADWRIGKLWTDGDSSRALIRHGADEIDLAIEAPGRHMVANAVAALAIAELAGVERQVALTALAGFGAPEGRGQAIRLGPAKKPLLLIDESYNANLASMAATLALFGEAPKPLGRKVLVLGDMLELGPQGPALHAGLTDAVLATRAEIIHLVGPSMQALANGLSARTAGLPLAPDIQHWPSVDAALDPVSAGLAYGDAVMVKGSNGVKLGLLVAAICERFKSA